jgi:hypothetical protein
LRSENIGRWRITEMAPWDNHFLDEEIKALMQFDGDGTGEFHFGNVHGQVD